MKMKILYWKYKKILLVSISVIFLIFLCICLFKISNLVLVYIEETYNFISILIDLSISLLTLLGVLFAVKQLSDTKKLNESQLVMDLNNEFISNPNMLEIERQLEMYFIGKGNLNNLKIFWASSTKGRQNLISYLVYFEGLSVSVQRKIISMESMDDLFAYRFFLAFHNPFVQQNELLDYIHYYRGCFVLYFMLSEVWLKRWILWKNRYPNGTKNEPAIPLFDYSLLDNQSVCDFVVQNKKISRRKIKRIKKMADYIRKDINMKKSRSIEGEIIE